MFEFMLRLLGAGGEGAYSCVACFCPFDDASLSKRSRAGREGLLCVASKPYPYLAIYSAVACGACVVATQGWGGC